MNAMLENNININDCAAAPLQTQYLHIKVIGEISGDTVTYYPKEQEKDLTGRIISGQITCNGQSAVRRAGSFNMVIDDKSEASLTDLEQPISINKIVTLEIGIVANPQMLPVLTITDSDKDSWPGDVSGVIIDEEFYAGFDTADDSDDALILTMPIEDIETVWQKLGTYVITDASCTKNLTSWNISASIQDQMALLNGTCGGTFSTTVTHSPVWVEDANGNTVSEPVKFTTIISNLLKQYAGLTGEKDIFVWNHNNQTPPAEAKAHIVIKSNDNRSDQTKQIVTWKGKDPAYLIKLAEIPPATEDSNGFNIYTIDTSEPDLEGTEVSQYKYNQSIGYQYTDFTYPMKEDLVSNYGSSVAQALEVIKGVLGNYEYFYDINGVFHFQEIDNGITSSESVVIDDLSSALIAANLANFDNQTIHYTFKDASLIVSYMNNPMFKNIKNDITIWGERGESKTAICYHLIVDAPSSFGFTDDVVYTNLSIITDDKGIKHAIKGGSESYKVPADDWRRHIYFRQVLEEDNSSLGLELVNFLPKIMDITDGQFISAKEDLDGMEYFIEMLFDNVSEEETTAQKYYEAFSVSKIGRRQAAKKVDGVNCIFPQQFADIVFIPLGQEDTAEQRNNAIDNQQSFIQVPESFNNSLELAVSSYSAFDALRAELNNLLSYGNTIQLQTIPLYGLEPNTLIKIDVDNTEDDLSALNGVYQINSLTIPLTHNGLMSISAGKVLVKV